MNNTLIFANAEAGALFWTLLGIFWISETIINSRLRAGAKDKADDRRSLLLLFVVGTASWILAWVCVVAIPQATFGNEATYVAGIAIMIIGLSLRWWSITTLGRFFTVNVAIRTEHRVIDSGPYRVIRHPSYTGILLVYLGIGLCMSNMVALVVAFVPCALSLLHRIHVEEDVLIAGLGDAYRTYMMRTKRLIPGIY
jgi:protein-S-isoprenylcysteine O-methyltransferase